MPNSLVKKNCSLDTITGFNSHRHSEFTPTSFGCCLSYHDPMQEMRSQAIFSKTAVICTVLISSTSTCCNYLVGIRFLIVAIVKSSVITFYANEPLWDGVRAVALPSIVS